MLARLAAAIAALAALAGCHGADRAAPPKSAAPTTSTAAAGLDPGGAVSGCVTRAVRGNCGPYRDPAIYRSDGQNTFVGQDVWNPIPGYSQTLYATAPGNWRVIASMPAGNTAVVSFPNVGQQYYYSNTLGQFSSIYSSFAEDMNPTGGTSAEAAYDIWLNGWHNEVMIQHDLVGRERCPALAHASFGGTGGVAVREWNLCQYGSELIWQLDGPGEHSGSVDVLAMLTWLTEHGYLPRQTGLTDISYGFEICSTGGRPEKFEVSRFTISAGE